MNLTDATTAKSTVRVAARACFVLVVLLSAGASAEARPVMEGSLVDGHLGAGGSIQSHRSADSPAGQHFPASQDALHAPALGTFPNTSVQTGGNSAVAPSSPPAGSGTIRMVATTSPKFQGQMVVDTATGSVRITNAQPSGIYTITVTARDGMLPQETVRTFMLTVTDPVACSPPVYRATGTASGATMPVSVAVGDVNNDGKQDVATANMGGSMRLAVRLGDGASGFGAPMLLSLPWVQVGEVIIADLNGDGNADLASSYNGVNVNDPQLVVVFLGDGAGGFGAAYTYASGGYRPRAIVAADLNGDARIDLAVANQNSDVVGILIGDGLGGYATAVGVGMSTAPADIAVGDFNNDSKADLVTANSGSGNFGFLRGNGDGTFQLPTFRSVGTTPVALAVADFNGDGNADVATANSGSANVTVRFGTGTGSFPTSATFAVGTNPSGIAAADLDGDGDKDLVVSNDGSSNLSMLLGNGSGGFVAATSLATDANPKAVVAADFNGDGKLDLVTPNSGPSTLTIQTEMCALSLTSLGNYSAATVQVGTNTVVTPDAPPSGDSSRTIVASAPGQFRGTLAVDNASGNVRVANAHPAGTYGITITARTTVGATSRSFSLAVTDAVACAPMNFPVVVDYTQAGTLASAVADINGDGRQDVLTAGGTSFTSRLGDGQSSLGVPVTLGIAGADLRGIAAGDVNGDGRMDAVLVDIAQDRLWILVGDGQGGFGNSGGLSLGGGTNVDGAALVDVDADGRLDLAAANGAGAVVAVLLGDGLGGFGTPTTFAVGTNPEAVAAGDFNGDGNLDLAVANRGSNDVSVLAGNGAGGFAAATAFGVGGTPRALVVADLDEDGDRDIATANQGSNNVSVLLGNGVGGFAAVTNYAAGTGPVAIGVGDFDGNGNFDLVTANGGSGSASVLLGNGAGGLGAATNFTVTTPASLAVADLNADSKQDLVATNAAGGRLYVLLQTCTTSPPTLGSYSGTAAQTGGNALITPSAVPGGDTPRTLTVSAPAKLRGTVLMDRATGEVRVTDVYPAGIYTLTMKAVNTSGIVTRSLTLTVTNVSACSPPAFAGAKAVTSDATAHLPVVGVADFNGDGNQDVVHSSSAGLQLYVVIQLGDGAGGFGSARTYVIDSDGIPILNMGLTVGDFNNDGRMDVVASWIRSNEFPPKPSYMSVLLGDGAGNLVGRADTLRQPNTGGSGLLSIATGDVNGDAKLDVLASTDIDNRVFMFMGDGVGTLAPVTTLTFAGNVGGLDLADVDLDGDRDIVVSSGASTVGVMLNDGPGTFAAPDYYTVGSGPKGVVVGDLNGDSYPDVVAANATSNNVAVILNDGFGGFDPPVFYAVSAGPLGVTVADLDADGDLDIAVTHSGSVAVSVLAGTGSGTFGAASSFAGYGTAQFGQPGNIVPADFNADGRHDLVTGATTGALSLLLGRCGNASPTLGAYPAASVQAGRSVTITPSAAPAGSPSGITASAPALAGILTVDNATGVVRVTNPASAGTYTVTVRAYNSMGSATRTFALTVTNPLACATLNFQELPPRYVIGSGGIYAKAADFTNDGRLDVVAITGQQQIVFLAGDGSGGFGPRRVIATGMTFYSFNLGDLNGDGNLDFTAAKAEPNGFVSLIPFLGGGNGGFSAGPQLGHITGLGLGDVNNDGRLDFVSESNGHLLVTLGNGDGSFLAAADAGVPAGTAKTLVDLNGDGNLDLVAGSSGGAQMVIRLGNGAGGFGAATAGPGGLHLLFRAGDFNSDTRPDIGVLYAGFESGAVAVLLGNGSGALAAAPTVGLFPNTDASTSLELADFNGDGQQDLVSGNGAARNLSIRLGNGAGRFGAGPNSGLDIPSAFNVRAMVGDFNGDGRQDLASTNGDANHMSVYLRTCNPAPSLGAYPNAAVGSGGNGVVTPSAAPSGVANLQLRAFAPNFGGSLVVSPTTGILRVTNAGPAGIYPVTIYATDDNGTATTTFTMSVSSPVQCGNIAFTTASTITVGGSPDSIAVADFNNDGNQDLIIGDDAGLLRVRPGDGAGGFGAALPATTTGMTEVIADVTGDGNLDAIGKRDLLTGNGAGGFVVTSPFYGKDNYRGALADYNQDGRWDLVYLRNYFGDATYRRMGAGTPANPFGASVYMEDQFGISGAIPSDLDVDGKTDLLFPRVATPPVYPQGFSRQMGDGLGAFGAPTYFPSIALPSFLMPADVSGDTKIDVLTSVVGGPSRLLVELVGDGIGGFSGPIGYIADNVPHLPADFNGDDKLDVATRDEVSGVIRVYPGRSGGVLGKPADVAGGVLAHALASGDFDTDGKRDMVALNTGTGTAVVLRNTCAMSPPAPTVGTYPNTTIQTGANVTVTASVSMSGASSANATAPRFGGLLAVDPATGAVRITNARPAGAYRVTIKAQNGGAETTSAFTLTVQIPIGCLAPQFSAQSTNFAGTNGGVMALGDFNGDARQDLVVGHYVACGGGNVCATQFNIMLGDGSGGFTLGSNNTLPAGGCAVPTVFNNASVTDFNGDGKADLVFGTYNGCSWFTTTYLGDGNGGFGSRVDLPGTLLRGVADLNNDGRPDLVMYDSSAVLYSRMGEGDGSFSDAIYSSGSSVGFAAETAFGDFNNDGLVDAVSGAGNFVGVSFGTGHGSFQAPIVSLTLDQLVIGIAPADFDRDGRLDIAVTYAGNAVMSVLLGNGDGTFDAPANYGSTTYSLPSAGDLNGDGIPDVAVATSAGVKLFLGRGDGVMQLAGTFGGPLADRWRVLHGNFNGDDRVDLVYAIGSGVTAFLGSCTPVARGDCNHDGALNAGDLSALPLELFDADGSWALDAPNSTYAGATVGCDANADAQVNAADFTCAVLKVFGGQAACGP